jgi:hypothetical protein
MRIRDGDSSDPGWKKVGSGINIPDPPHWAKGAADSVKKSNNSRSAFWTRILTQFKIRNQEKKKQQNRIKEKS